MELDLKPLILEIASIQVVKFGQFSLKNGTISPIYIDFKPLISFPKTLKNLSEILWLKIQNLQFDLLFGATPLGTAIATCLSVAHDIPLVVGNKEIKEQGRQKVDGFFKSGQHCLIIEDILSANSLIDLKGLLKEEGLCVRDAVLIFDRHLKGKEKLKEQGIQSHCLFTLTHFLETLLDANKLDPATFKLINDYLDLA
jgi:uridine monophosphate synthetase